MQLPVLLDRARPEGLTVQIVEQVRDAIRAGRIAGGVRLPSSRRLAEQLDVSRNTVVRAYEILESEGYVEARAASGIFASLERPEPLVPPADAAAAAVGGAAMPEPLPALRVPRLLHQGSARLSFDFVPGRPNASLFPLKTWRRLMHGCLSHGGAQGLTQYSDPGGLSILRTAIAAYLAAARGIVADPGRIIIVGGVQEGLWIAARLFLAPGRRAVVETPCYQGAAFAFEAAGADLQPVPVDEEGLLVGELPARPASLLYVTPSHQYPTGGTLPLGRRHALIEWARRTGCHIVEDDYDGDFRYEGSPLPAVAALGPDCTIHLGTFSKSLGAGLRLGYMVVPARLADAARAAKALLNAGSSWLEQATLAEFMRAGSFTQHLMRCRTQYRENRDALIHALRRHFGDVVIGGEPGGLHLLWHLPPGVPEAPVLEAMARKARIGIYSLASANAEDLLDTPLGRRGIVLGYGALTVRQIEQGIARLSDLIDDTLDARPEFVETLLVNEPLRVVLPSAPAPRVRQRPALRAAGPLPALSIAEPFVKEVGTMQVVRGIYRYPVKGLSAQPLAGIVLEAGKPFPFDRVFALARPGVPIDEDDPKWAKKGLFVMLMLDEALAQVRSHLDSETLLLTVSDAEKVLLEADLSREAGRREVERFVRRLVPALRDEPRLVRSRAGHFMDKPENVVSLINLATLRHLEEQWGVAVDPLRFRANLYIDGVPPWQEFDWIGSDIRVGDAVFRVDRRNGRCGATNVNPATGRRDLDIPAALRAAYGHKDLGVYLLTRKGGKVVVGDPVAPPNARDGEAPPPVPIVSAAPQARQRFICRGCYFIYDVDKGHGPDGLMPGTAFAEIPAGWRCPDCGTDKSAFRPYPPA